MKNAVFHRWRQKERKFVEIVRFYFRSSPAIFAEIREKHKLAGLLGV